jgi:hypothetical protein
VFELDPAGHWRIAISNTLSYPIFPVSRKIEMREHPCAFCKHSLTSAARARSFDTLTPE